MRIRKWSSDVCSSDRDARPEQVDEAGDEQGDVSRLARHDCRRAGLCGSARPLGGAEEWAWAAGVASATVATPALGAERGRLAHPFLSSVPQKSGPERL